jgi:hypothetical protein
MFAPEVIGRVDVPVVPVVLELNLPQVPKLIELRHNVVIPRPQLAGQMSGIAQRKFNLRELRKEKGSLIILAQTLGKEEIRQGYLFSPRPPRPVHLAC